MIKEHIYTYECPRCNYRVPIKVEPQEEDKQDEMSEMPK